MKNIFIFLMTLIAGITTTKAQLKVPASYGSSIAIGGGFNDVTGPAAQYYHAGADAVVKAEFHATEEFNFTASVGFQSFFPSSTYRYRLLSTNQPVSNYNFIPVKGGGRYYFDESWYAEAEAGAVLYTIDYRDPAITIGAGGGYSFQLDGNRAFDVGARFENWSRKDIPGQQNISHMLSLRLAYKIGM